MPLRLVVGLVDEAVEHALGVVGVGAAHRAGEVVHRVPGHHLGVGARGEAFVAEVDGVDAGDAGQAPQAGQQLLVLRELGVLGQDRDEDRLARVLDLLRERLGLGLRELVLDARVHVDRALAQLLGDLGDAGGGVGVGRRGEHSRAGQREQGGEQGQ